MADATLQILGLGTSAVPLDYNVTGDTTLDLVAVKADFDGTAAGANFVPVVEIISPAGEVMAQSTGPTVTAGSSATVTFAPFLRSAATSSGAGITEITSGDGTITVSDPFGPITDLSGYVAPQFQETLNSSVFTVGAGASATVSWVHLGGSTNLDLTTPTAPKVHLLGTYAFSGNFSTSNHVAAARQVTCGLSMVNSLASGVAADAYTAPTGGGFALLSFSGTFVMTTTDHLTLNVFNGDTVNNDFQLTAMWCQRIA